MAMFSPPPLAGKRTKSTAVDAPKEADAKPTGAAAAAAEDDSSGYECCICLETVSNLPIRMPCCKNKFCYLCIKSVKLKNGPYDKPTCPLCRADIDPRVIDAVKMPTTFYEAKFKREMEQKQKKKNPTKAADAAAAAAATGAAAAAAGGGGGGGDASAGATTADGEEETRTGDEIDEMVQWKYSGRSYGWWLYDDASNAVIERHYQDYTRKKADFDTKMATGKYVVAGAHTLPPVPLFSAAPAAAVAAAPVWFGAAPSPFSAPKPSVEPESDDDDGDDDDGDDDGDDDDENEDGDGDDDDADADAEDDSAAASAPGGPKGLKRAASKISAAADGSAPPIGRAATITRAGAAAAASIAAADGSGAAATSGDGSDGGAASAAPPLKRRKTAAAAAAVAADGSSDAAGAAVDSKTDSKSDDSDPVALPIASAAAAAAAPAAVAPPPPPPVPAGPIPIVDPRTIKYELSVGMRAYVIDFEGMAQADAADYTKRRKIMRDRKEEVVKEFEKGKGKGVEGTKGQAGLQFLRMKSIDTGGSGSAP